MTATLDERTQALSLPRLLAPEICDVFVRTLWKDLLAGRAAVQTHQQQGLRKNAIEIHGCAAARASLGPDADRHQAARPRSSSSFVSILRATSCPSTWTGPPARSAFH
jgi:hypothetical protein